MSFVKKLGNMFKKSAKEEAGAPPAEPPPRQSQEAIRKSAVRRKLKDIGYRTEEIRVATGKSHEKSEEEKTANEPKPGNSQ